MFANIFSDPFSVLLFVISLLFALTVHEAAHAWAANRLGDPTAKFSGRLTLNPLAHLDPIGTIMLFFFGFGWGKPVPVDEFNLNKPRRDNALIALAGPAVNLVVALFIGLFRLPVYFLGLNSLVISGLMLSLIRLNIILGVFNLLPIYPLDGSKILIGVLPEKTAQAVDLVLKRYGVFLLIFALLPVFFGRSLVSLVLVPAVSFFEFVFISLPSATGIL